GMFWHSRSGLFPAWDEFAADRGRGGKERVFWCNSPGEMAGLANWLVAAGSQRDFLINIKKHSMAGVGAKSGGLAFLDRNGGVVTAPSASNMAFFFSYYFNNPKIKHYYNENGLVKLQVSKYKS